MKHQLLLLTFGFTAAVALVLYPYFAQIWNQYVISRCITQYRDSIADADTEYEEALVLAQSYNTALLTGTSLTVSGETLTTEEAYDALLDLTGSGVMGTLLIPAINVILPIYHGTDETVLQSGIGHLESSSLPVGGPSTHAVLTGHRGLASSVLLTDLDQLETGDVFFIEVLDETLAYEVYEIETVLPDETSSLAVSAGEDLVTLVTCTPYGVNTHRLLVHAARTELTEELLEYAQSTTVSSSGRNYLLLIAAGELAAYLIVLKTLIKQNHKGG